MTKACPRCRRESALHFRATDRNRRISELTFDYYRCPDCELIFLSPIPADLGVYYASDYHTIPQSLQELADTCKPEQYKINLVRQYAQPGRLLEIGSSRGAFAYLAKQACFEVEAIEMDAACCDFLSNVVGIRAINSDDVVTALKDCAPYDVIALWHVIEHLPDPWTTLNALAAALSPGGILVVAAPNPAAFQFRVTGRYWPHLDAPRHLELIPAPLLSRHLAGQGLRTILCTTVDEGGLYWNSFGWQRALSNCTTNRYVKRLLRMTGQLITALLRPIERGGLRGSAYTCIFQKEPVQ